MKENSNNDNFFRITVSKLNLYKERSNITNKITPHKLINSVNKTLKKNDHELFLLSNTFERTTNIKNNNSLFFAATYKYLNNIVSEQEKAFKIRTKHNSLNYNSNHIENTSLPEIKQSPIKKYHNASKLNFSKSTYNIKSENTYTYAIKTGFNDWKIRKLNPRIFPLNPLIKNSPSPYYFNPIFKNLPKVNKEIRKDTNKQNQKYESKACSPMNKLNKETLSFNRIILQTNSTDKSIDYNHIKPMFSKINNRTFIKTKVKNKVNLKESRTTYYPSNKSFS